MYRIYDNNQEEFIDGEYETLDEAESDARMIADYRERNKIPYDFDVYMKCE